MRIFLTGGTGFVGRHTVRWLLANVPEASITVLVRDPSRAQTQWANEPLVRDSRRISWLPGDLLAPETYGLAAQQAEVVIHAAALVSLRNGPEFEQANVGTTDALLTVLQSSAALQRLVFISSISAIDRPLSVRAVGPLTEASTPHPNSDYGRSKLQAEQLVQASGLPYTVLRPAYIFGPDPRPNSSMDRLVQDIRCGARYTRFPFPGRASAIAAEDLASMIWLASQHPNTLNQGFFACNPEPVIIRDAFALLTRALGITRPPRTLSDNAIARISDTNFQRTPDALLQRILFEDFFLCDGQPWFDVTGQTLPHTFEETLLKTAHWYQTQPK